MARTYRKDDPTITVTIAEVAGAMTVIRSNCPRFPVWRKTAESELRAEGWRRAARPAR